MPPPSGYQSSQLIFDDTFSGTTLDASKWNTYMTSGAADGDTWYGTPATWSAIGLPGGDNLEDYTPSHVVVNNGLNLVATAGSAQPGYAWTSGIVDTEGHFALSSGYIQVKAKIPDTSSGMWPAIWFLPNSFGTPDINEIDLQEGGSLLDGVPTNRIMASNLNDPGNSQQVFDTGTDLSAGYHVYGMQFLPGKSVTMYLDDKQVAQFTSNVGTVPMELIINLAVTADSWHSVVGPSTPSPSTLSVAEVQAYS